MKTSIFKSKYIIALVSVLFLAVGSFFGLILQLIPTHAATGTTLFESIGKYAFATAGSNNNTRGTSYESYEHVLETNRFITNYPDNWSSILSKLKNSGITSVSNITGSYLKAPGKTKKAIFSYIAYSDGEKYAGRILIIKPDNTYFILNVTGGTAGNVDITDYLTSDNSEGWYYVSFLDAARCPQNSWSILAAYENADLSTKYIKMINANKYLSGYTSDSSIEIDLNSNLKLKDSFQLVGVIAAGGIGAWPVPGETEDRAWAILTDGSYKQLYEQTYRGRTIFADRTNTDFANGTFNTTRTTNLRGGEMDIWDEVFSNDYFNNKGIIGYKFQKDGANTIYISVLGLTQEIEMPNMSVIPKIDNTSTDNTVTSTITVSNTSEYNSCSTKLEVVLDEKLMSVDNLTVVVNDKDGKVVNVPNTSNYDSGAKKLTVTFNSIFKSGYIATVTYKSNETSSTKNKIDLDPVLSYFPAYENECLTEVTTNNNLKQVTTNHDDAPIPVKVTTNHYIYGTKTSFNNSTSIIINKGDNYSTSCVDIPGYICVANDGDGVNGVATKENIIVNYYYKQTVLNVNPIITKTGDDKITSKDQLIKYQINYNVVIADYYGNAITTIVDTLPYKIDVKSADLDGGIYDEATKTISWVENIPSLDTYINGDITLSYQKNVSYKYLDSEYQNGDRLLTNKATGSIQTADTKIVRETNYITSLDIPAKVIVNHYLKGTNIKVADTDIYNTSIGQSYISRPNDNLVAHYNITYPDNARGIVDKDVVIVDYYYELINNPNTNDFILMYGLTFLLSLMTLTILITKQKELK